MLLVYNLDSKTDAFRRVENYVLKLNLGFFPKKRVRITLKMVTWAVDNQGGELYLEFPDVRPRYIEEEIVDALDEWELPGIAFETSTGTMVLHGRGNFDKSSDCRTPNLDLGFMDPQKDFFSVILNARFGTGLGNLNNLCLVFEMHDATSAT